MRACKVFTENVFEGMSRDDTLSNHQIQKHPMI